MRSLRVLLLLLLLSFLLTACEKKENAGPVTATATPAPDFTLKDLNGKAVTLSDYRGKIVLLNLWATWCPPCRAEIPSMERLNEVFAGKDFVMLAVNVDDNLNSLVDFMKSTPHNFTVLHDSEGKVQRLYRVDKFPETFVIGKDGTILEHIVGARDWASPQALKYFSELVNGR